MADAIRGLAGRYSSVLLANHGPVVAGDSLEAAVFATEELEETAKLYLLLRNLNPRYLTPHRWPISPRPSASTCRRITTTTTTDRAAAHGAGIHSFTAPVMGSTA